MQERCYDDTRLPLERRREYLSWRRLTLCHTSLTPADWSLDLETKVCKNFTITNHREGLLLVDMAYYYLVFHMSESVKTYAKTY